MLLDLLVLFTVLYFIQICLFAIGAHRAQYTNDPSFRPTASIIIAARNEEANIKTCLESIARLTYPRNLLEVVIVNDRSTDRTEEIIKEFSAKHSFIKLHIATEDPSSKLQGKTNAIAQGIDLTDGEFILFTDADCVVPVGWVEETVKYYCEEKVGLVAGFTSLKTRTGFEKIQALDWFVLFSIAAATIRLHFPVTAIGNNLSVRRKAYDDAGGYRNIPFSITEDYALFNAVTSSRKYRAKFPVDENTLVESLPCPDFRSLFRQKKRWFIGGADMDFGSISLFATGFIFKLLLVLTLFVSGIGAVLIPFLFKVIADVLLVRPALSRFKKTGLLWYFLPFELFYTAYVVIFPPLVLFNRSVVWKDRAFK